MTPNQPYLLRAFFDWIVDNQMTPYIVVDATNELAEVPQEFVKEGQIVLNVSPSACVNFALDLEFLSFQARFGGQPRNISMPIWIFSMFYLFTFISFFIYFVLSVFISIIMDTYWSPF